MDALLFFKSLADDTRLQILLLVCHEQELCVCELTQALKLSQPKISRHLALLRDSGLLVDSKQGRWVFYRLSEQLLPWQLSSLQQCLSNELNSRVHSFGSAASQGFTIRHSLERLKRMGNRPMRQQQCCDNSLADHLL